MYQLITFRAFYRTGKFTTQLKGTLNSQNACYHPVPNLLQLSSDPKTTNLTKYRKYKQYFISCEKYERIFRNLFYDCVVNEQVGPYLKVENRVVFIGYHKYVKYLTIMKL
jgi:hypothetical protein